MPVPEQPTAESPADTLHRHFLRMAPNDGLHETAWPDLQVFRASQVSARFPVVYEPCIFMVAHGRKCIYLQDQTCTYDPLNYLVAGVPVPAEAEILEASPGQPFLSCRLAIDTTVLSELLIDSGHEAADTEPARAIYSSAMHPALSNALVRLVKCLADDRARPVLAPMAVREILYHILHGEQGERLKAIALRDSRAHRIGSVLNFMRDHYARPLGIDDLAERAFMSTSAFHHNFKAVTSISPLQYLKMIRLHQARALLLEEGINAGDAAHAVGYKSPSQFTREFKRLFGEPPLREIRKLQTDAANTHA